MKFVYKKLLQIDATAAFDNVKREAITAILVELLGEDECLSGHWHGIWERINTTNGVFQGDSYSSLLFCKYIDKEIWDEPGTHAFIDEIATQAVT